jgi:hypothetical protein
MHKTGDAGFVINCRKNFFLRRSVSADLDLEAGEYQVFVKVEAKHHRSRPVEDTVRENIEPRRAKLVQVAMKYDKAHIRVRDEAQLEETKARKRNKRRKLDRLKASARRQILKRKQIVKHHEKRRSESNVPP